MLVVSTWLQLFAAELDCVHEETDCDLPSFPATRHEAIGTAFF